VVLHPICNVWSVFTQVFILVVRIFCSVEESPLFFSCLKIAATHGGIGGYQ